MVLSVVAFVGEYRANAGHDREGGQEQPLEDKRVIDIGCRGEAGDRDAVPVGPDVGLGAPLAAVGRMGAGKIAAARRPAPSRYQGSSRGGRAASCPAARAPSR